MDVTPARTARFIPSVPGYTYAHKDGDVYVNLFMSGTGEIETAGNKITLTQKTGYPWQDGIHVAVEPEPLEPDLLAAALLREPASVTVRPDGVSGYVPQAIEVALVGAPDFQHGPAH